MKKKGKAKSGHGALYYIAIFLVVLCVLGFILGIISAAWPLLLVCALVVAGIYIYALTYFKGQKFGEIKESISAYITDCNDLNAHIEDLRSTYTNIKKTDYGEATYSNVGKNNYTRSGLANAKYAPNIYDCSSTVCDSARKQPFKYICKYFNIPENEASLELFEGILNNFAAAEEGKELSRRKREEILARIADEIPWIIKKFFQKRLVRELGFDEFQFDELYFPVYSFRYISSGGNSGTQFDVTMDMNMLERFVYYLSERVKFKKSAAGQRRLMTPHLRRFIIDRDKSTCRICGNSTSIEPNLLLEVDHIIPIAKGGLTTENNLQTLCWKCNRHKGSKMPV